MWYGAQLEAGAFATSYIPTAAATVTRAADVMTFPSSGNVLATAITVFSRVTSLSGAANQRVLGINDGTTNNRNLDLYFGTATQVAAFGNNAGVTQFNLAPASGSISTYVPVRVAAVAATNYANCYLNGIGGTADTSVTPPASPTQIEIGALVGSNQGALCLRDARIWQRVLSDSQIASIT